jgi:hypothetical protein
VENTPTPAPQKWYNKGSLVFLLCILFFPIGLYGVYKSDTIGKVGKAIGLVYFIALMAVIFGEKKEQPVKTLDAAAIPEKELTQTQKDSVLRVELTNRIEERKKQSVGADILVRIYEANEVRADENFKNETIYVEGTISSIAKDILDKPYVTLASDNDINEVQCYMSNPASASQLNKGDRITLKGTVQGKIMLNVVLKDCEEAESLAGMRANLKALKK